MDVIFLDSRQFGVNDEGLGLFRNIHFDRRHIDRRVHINRTDKEAAEQVIKRIETGQFGHGFLE